MTQGIPFKPNALALAVLTMAALPQAHALDLDLGSEWRGNLDTTLTIGSAWRAARRDPALIGAGNGGTAANVSIDDGDLNFRRGDAVSQVVRATHELDLSRGNFGIFSRVTYAYDSVAASDRIDAYGGSASRTGRELRLLDLYGRYNTDFGGKAFAIRGGSQVLNWGESLFIQNGLSVINPVDLSKLRSPGTELREAYIPTPMVWASQQLGPDSSIEGFVLFKADHYRLDPRGTFFSTNDAASGRVGGANPDRLYLNALRPDQRGLNPAETPGYDILNGGTGQFWLDRTDDKKAVSADQFGLSLRKAFPELNQLELGFYAMQYTSRVPFVSVNAAAPGGVPSSANPFYPQGSGSYFLEYPSRIRVFGVSARAQGPFGMALQGEYTYRPNQPVQLADRPTIGALAGLTGLVPPQIAALAGQTLTGYERVKMHQLQVSATKSMGATLGASSSLFAAEVGYTRLGLDDSVAYDGPGTYLTSSRLVSSMGLGSVLASQSQGFLTRSSWGYVLAYQMDYTQAVSGMTLSPRVSFSHDVNGTGPTFTQGVRSLSLGASLLSADKRWKADLSYTRYSGGRTYRATDPATGFQFASSSNPLKDRDFVALSLSYAF